MVVLVDLATKAWARDSLGKARHLWGPLWLRLQYNSGVSFSFNRGLPLMSALVALAVALVVLVIGSRAAAGFPTWGFGLLIGGGVGNVANRFLSSPPRVTDFVAVSSFPVFNAADAAITVGFLTLLVAILRGQRMVGS